MPTAPLDLKPLTTLRILAALWVVLADYWGDRLGAGAPPRLVSHGLYGVELFFVLSGFILCHVYLRSFGEKRFGYGGFLWARLARIYPLHLATLLAVGAMGVTAMALGIVMKHPVLYWPALLPNLLLMNAWGFTNDAGWNHPAWSISAEWFAYLMFPLFAAAAWGLRRRPAAAMAGSVALLLVIYPLFQRLAGFALTDATIAWGALRIVPCFTLGCAAYLVWSAQPIRSEALATLCSLTALALATVLVSLGAPTALVVACFGALIVSLASLTSTGSRLFGHPALVYLGEVSFAVYMVAIPWKMLVLSGAQKLLHLGGEGLPWPIWLAYFAGVLPAAMALHHLVERPARTAMRKISAAKLAGALRIAGDETSRNIA
jgi:peptidoglycan/LPS O-acetylase OafA/YrhL